MVNTSQNGSNPPRTVRSHKWNTVPNITHCIQSPTGISAWSPSFLIYINYVISNGQVDVSLSLLGLIKTFCTLKCCFTFFIPALSPSLLFVNDTILHMVEQIRYLGVLHLSLDATWSAHINMSTVRLKARSSVVLVN